MLWAAEKDSAGLGAWRVRYVADVLVRVIEA